MPGILQPADLMAYLGRLEERVQRLERPPGAFATSRIGGLMGGPLAAQPYSATWVDLPGTSWSFTLARTANVLLLSTLIFSTAGGTATTGEVTMQVDAGVSGISAVSWCAVPGTANAAPYVSMIPLSAGVHTVNCKYAMIGGAATTLTLQSFQMDAFLLGG